MLAALAQRPGLRRVGIGPSPPAVRLAVVIERASLRVSLDETHVESSVGQPRNRAEPVDSAVSATEGPGPGPVGTGQWPPSPSCCPSMRSSTHRYRGDARGELARIGSGAKSFTIGQASRPPIGLEAVCLRGRASVARPSCRQSARLENRRQPKSKWPAGPPQPRGPRPLPTSCADTACACPQ